MAPDGHTFKWPTFRHPGTSVYAIRDVAAGEELSICYLPDVLPAAAPELRAAFIRNRFDFACRRALACGDTTN